MTKKISYSAHFFKIKSEVKLSMGFFDFLFGSDDDSYQNTYSSNRNAQKYSSDTSCFFDCSADGNMPNGDNHCGGWVCD